ncbi:hypothetical protein BDZ89DRAFT_1145805 [Hymenopellis radicata]|nr:hypothetical protein BDZ89DRAFT_1145805 [Hymenopellis radicata]
MPERIEYGYIRVIRSGVIGRGFQDHHSGVALRDAAAQYEADFGGRARIFALMCVVFVLWSADFVIASQALVLSLFPRRVDGFAAPQAFDHSCLRRDGFAIGCVEWAGPEREKSKRWVYDEETVNKYRWACWDVEEDLREAKHFFVPGCYYKLFDHL